MDPVFQLVREPDPDGRALFTEKTDSDRASVINGMVSRRKSPFTICNQGEIRVRIYALII